MSVSPSVHQSVRPRPQATIFVLHTHLWYKTLYNRCTFTLFLLTKKRVVRTSKVSYLPLPRLRGTLNTPSPQCPGHVEVAVPHRGSGHRSLSEWQLPAIEVAVTRRRSGHHPSSRNRPSPVFAAASARCCQPSQLLSPPLAVAVATAAFACRCMHSQLPLPAVTAAVASCRLSLGCLWG